MKDYTIKATIRELRKSADDINRNARKVNGEVDRVESIVNRLKSTFLGESASAFFTEFKKSQSYMNEWDDIVRSFAKELDAAADYLHRADKAGKR